MSVNDSVDRLASALSERYRIESEIGAGGMATVYLAEDLKHERKVAVKVLRPELAAVLGAERFVQEIKTTANLQHPHILPLFDSGEAEGFLYYVMPFIDGETLRDKLNRETQLGIEEAVGITTAIADALDYAHRNNVIHRDIKPENILLHDGRPMVADFGIALALSAAAGGRMTETGLSLGTPHYMSPEQATAEKDITNRSDIYSLGCVLYEMLTGEPPHTGASAQAIVMRIVTDDARPVMELRKSVPPNVAAATAKSLEKLAADRFATASQFAEALTNPAFAPASRDPAAPRVATPSLWGRQTLALASLAAVLAVVLTGMVISFRLEQSSDLGVARFRVGLAANEVLGSVWVPGLAFAPDGKRWAYGGPGEGQPQLWLRSMEKPDATLIRGSETGCCPTFSPDGQSIAFMTQLMVLRIVSLGGGPARTVADSGFSDLSLYGGGVDWGPDGYLYVSGLDGLVRVSPEGGPLEPMATLNRERGDRTYAWPDVLPNANGALVTVIPEDVSDLAAYGIGVVNFAAGSVDIVLQGIYARYAISGHVIFLQDDGTLLAAPFNENRLAVTGPAEPLLAGLRTASVGATQLAVSETGSLLYATGTATVQRVVWVDRDGTEEDIDPDWTGRFETPSLSPDGSRLAVSLETEGQGQNIWTKTLDGEAASRLTFAGAVNFRPSWTPDGRSLMFVSDRSNEAALYQKAADGGGGAALVPVYEPRPVFAGEWSRDSQWLVFRTDNAAPGQGDILALRTGVDTVPQPVVATPAEEVSPALSPDARWLAYVSDKSGRREVYVQPFPNSANTLWQISTTGGAEPLWSHSGRELFYRDFDQNLIAVQVVYDPAFRSVSQRVLFSVANYSSQPWHRNYDITADDQQFVMIRGLSHRRGSLILVLNFFEELKAKVGR